MTLKKKHILIVSSPLDLHARAVAWAVREYGSVASFFDTSEPWPKFGAKFSAHGKMNSYCLAQQRYKFDSVWYRRRFPKDVNYKVDESDRKFVLNELTIFERDLLQLLELHSGARWIDPPAKQRTSENKLLQLNLAQKHGMLVPDTYVGTDASEIRKFIKKYGKVAIKPFFGQVWKKDGKPRYEALTAIVESGDQLSDDTLRVCPAIYQRAIDKCSDVRVVRIGRKLYPVEYRASQDKYKSIDIRLNIRMDDLSSAKNIKIPKGVASAFMSMTDDLGITYASSDFICDKQDKWYFVDLNPVGQFLFNEAYVPEHLLLDAMTRHILGVDCRATKQLRWKDYIDTKDYESYSTELASASGNAVIPELFLTDIDDAKQMPATIEG